MSVTVFFPTLIVGRISMCEDNRAFDPKLCLQVMIFGIDKFLMDPFLFAFDLDELLLLSFGKTSLNYKADNSLPLCSLQSCLGLLFRLDL